MKALSYRTLLLPAALALIGLSAPQAHAQFTLNAFFGSSITGNATTPADPNAAAIESTINSAVAFYNSNLTTKFPDVVNIAFGEMTSGLGQSGTFIGTISYNSFLTHLDAAQSSADDAAALAVLDLAGSAVDPVMHGSNIAVSTANLRALGLPVNPPVGPFEGVTKAFDGFITLNTHATTPGSPGSPGTYSLFAVTAHEIDEVLGLGSSVGRSGIRPEDLFRYDSTGHRNFTTLGDNAYFSIDGKTNLVQFNQDAGGDYGDWHTSGTPRVQDAFGTPGSSPTPGIELRALDVVGYNLQGPSATPEFGSVFSLGGLLLAGGAGLWFKRRGRTVAKP